MVRAANKVLMDALARASTVVTANKRLARYLRAEYARLQVSAGRRAWETPKAVSAGRWLRDCWARAVDGGLAGADAGLLVLTPEQEALIWESVVGLSAAGRNLMSVERTAAEVARAYKLFHDYRIARSDLKDTAGDVAVFADWMAVFDSRCESEGWLPRVRLTERLAALAERGVAVAEGRVVFAGFDTVTPALAHLQDVLRRKGVAIEDVAPAEAAGGGGGRVVRVECTTTEEEWDTAARWVCARLKRDPGASLCVVVPDLAATRPRVVRAFRRVLEPRSLLSPDIESAPQSFNVSVGTPLASEPMVRTALVALRLTVGEVAVVEAGSVLRSPYIGGHSEEVSVRAQLDAEMRGWGGLNMSGWRLARDDRAKAMCPGWVRRLRQALRAVGVAEHGFGARVARPAGEWTEKFAAALDALGWPAVRFMTSRERQTLAEWRELLAAYEALGCVAGEEPASLALQRLSRLAGERIFQPQSPETRVQVLGGLEAGGLEFDAVWVTGLHDGVSPGAAAPNPFLPLEVQTRVGIRDATAGLRAEFGARVIRRLLRSAPEVVVSHARREGDVAQRPSPFVAHLPAVSPSALALAGGRPPHETLLGQAVLETVDDTMAPAITGQDAVYGGAYRVKQHSDCPFRAFAQHRLGAEEWHTPTLGLSPMERGSLIHSALEAVWRRYRTIQALRAHVRIEEDPADGSAMGELDPEFDKTVAESVREAIRKLQKERPDLPRTMPAFWDIEFQRLMALVSSWMIEEARDLSRDFEVVVLEGKVLDGVTGVVEPARFVIGGLAFRGRVDRVDRLPDGRLVITDYKTGSMAPSKRDWKGVRPAEPQLPLYATAGPWKPNEIAGIQFGVITPKGFAVDGWRDTDFMDGNSVRSPVAAWLEVLSQWRAVLDRIGQEMREGYASVDPREGGDPCRNCPLPTLCRVGTLDRPDLKEGLGDDEAHD